MKNDISKQSLVLGIDTGGTYTDAVLLDYFSRKVLATHKSLTTKRDFSIGIGRVIDGIHIDDPSAIQMVSVSTTLATNAIAESKGKRVVLFLIGYDPDLISSFKMENSFATPNYYYFLGGHDLYGREKAELDLTSILSKVNEVKQSVDAIAVSSYFSPLNPEHEIRTQKAISAICDLPIVLGHQLSTKLNSVERATTAALNASLLSILQDFIIAVRQSMELRGIEAPLMVVRGDGTLMSDEFATRTPVETIHSGPAASAIGGRFLSPSLKQDTALIVDVGGTTTDVALIQRGQVTISEKGAIVSGYKTSVGAANLLSIGLGCDSHITLNRKKVLSIGPERVVPLAYLCKQYPDLRKKLKSLVNRNWTQSTPDWLEHWFLLREPKDESLLDTSRKKELIALLRQGPIAVPEIIQKLNILHINQLNVDELVRQEIIAKAGLTPTDLLHVSGVYSPWDVEAATWARQFFCNSQFLDPDEFDQIIWTQITDMIIRTIITFLSDKKVPHEEDLYDEFGLWLYKNSIYPNSEHFATTIRLVHPIIGIGAPAEVFLQEVSQKLLTKLVLPQHHEVANAVGAVAGSIMVSEEVIIYPKLSNMDLDIIGYYVQAGDGREEFSELEIARKYAIDLSKERALNAALRSGADNPQVTVEELSDGLDSYRIKVKAIGNPRLMR